MPTKPRGFTLIEMVVVLAVVAILLTLALPDSSRTIVRTQMRESLKLIEHYQPLISAGYRSTGVFPADNEAAGIPPADKIIGNYVTAIVLEKGAFHLQFGNKIRNDLDGKRLSIRPVYVPNSPQSPVSWICGNDSIPTGMAAAGSNRTDIDSEFLPFHCR
ncbi:prepilin-type N-terminal cleavage/methylation domain-containing protein [Exilibacterium tricleocarpae]|uniref:Prepilin-type N-terminal cleavage/methylation domain-containing protein n=1 Tax=Exilibacterium tricleocarpae TaxID=2591008 RepID=A0A545SP18_9GAMM|nr:pilin [Exilibacterium tricleocarpae]TQV66701.1 prepilin-type N-terminal cleavage/methylation domain-containing protein [Exilibacterium tricleocarpae]